jgi:hypothetical protein
LRLRCIRPAPCCCLACYLMRCLSC